MTCRGGGKELRRCERERAIREKFWIFYLRNDIAKAAFQKSQVNYKGPSDGDSSLESEIDRLEKNFQHRGPLHPQSFRQVGSLQLVSMVFSKHAE